MPESAATPRRLDVRPILRSERHDAILTVFEDLDSGQSFELVNDHDPLGLLYQFNRFLPGAFTWDYLATGPDEWRVRIGRV